MTRRRCASRARPMRRPAEVPAPAIRPAPVRQDGVRAAAAALCAALVVLLMTYQTRATDVWQHLLVGKVIWQTHAVPTTQLWSWPTYGAPDVNSSWGFEALLYPFYRAGGVLGLFVWRWWTALLSCALAWATARRLGATFGVSLFCAVLAAIMARPRMQPRPETLSAVLWASFLWLLEERRQGGKDRTAWLVPLAWIWANTHISGFLGLFAVGVHAVAGHVRPRPGSNPARLWIVLALCLGVSFLNPFGWRALWEPFRFAWVGRTSPLYQAIDELRGLGLGDNWREWTPLVLFAWPALFLWRGARGRWDGVEGTLLVVCEALAWTGRRFVIYAAFAMAPFVARALGECLQGLPAGLRRWTSDGRAAAATVGLAALAAVPTLTHRTPAIGMAFARDSRFPGVCDFIERHDVSGRMFNAFQMGGYILWRFWPGRLPFMDIHQAGTPQDLADYLAVFQDEDRWRAMETRDRFDHLVLPRVPVSDSLFVFLDRDTSWALVFADDVSALYLRRGGRFDPVIATFAYHDLAVGAPELARLGERAAADTVLRARLRVELERMAVESADRSNALSLLANLDMLDGRLAEALSHIIDARRVNPGLPRYHERLGILHLLEGQPALALDEFRAELRESPGADGLEARLGEAYLAMGNRGRARAQFMKELSRHPGNPVALAGLRQLGGP